MPPQSLELTDQRDLFAPTAKLPPGFVYRQDFISIKEEQEMIEHFEQLSFKPFEFHGFLGKRRVVSFGWRYDFSGRTLRSSETIPPFLLTLRQRAAEFADVDPDGLQQILINEYASGAGIGWHRDKPMFEKVIGLSFGAPCVMRLRRALDHGWERASCPLQPRSVYLLRGPSRQEWQHSIPPLDQLRYSVTFRNFSKSGAL
jgi:alkylated DNA repair dioxygenase AlkB